MQEFDTPLALFDQAEGLFRSMADKSGIIRQDLLGARSYDVMGDI